MDVNTLIRNLEGVLKNNEAKTVQYNEIQRQLQWFNQPIRYNNRWLFVLLGLCSVLFLFFNLPRLQASNGEIQGLLFVLGVICVVSVYCGKHRILRLTDQIYALAILNHNNLVPIDKPIGDFQATYTNFTQGNFSNVITEAYVRPINLAKTSFDLVIFSYVYVETVEYTYRENGELKQATKDVTHTMQGIEFPFLQELGHILIISKEDNYDISHSTRRHSPEFNEIFNVEGGDSQLIANFLTPERRQLIVNLGHSFSDLSLQIANDKCCVMFSEEDIFLSTTDRVASLEQPAFFLQELNSMTETEPLKELLSFVEQMRSFG